MRESKGFYHKMPKFGQPSLDLIVNLSTGYTLPNPTGRPKKNFSQKKSSKGILSHTLQES